MRKLDFEELITCYDSPETFFYCDPPYLKEGDDLYSHDGGFDHDRFTSCITDIEGLFTISYLDLPSELQSGYTIREKTATYHMGKGHDNNSGKEKSERLVMNFDPEQTPMFHKPEQATLSESTVEPETQEGFSD